MVSIGMASCKLGVGGAKAVAEMASVMGSLTSLDLSSNSLCSVTETGYIKASKVQGASFNVGDKVMYEGKEMIVSRAKDSDGDIKMTNLPDLSGVNAIADALRVNGSMTRLDVRLNLLGEEGEAVLRQAIEGRSGFEVVL